MFVGSQNSRNDEWVGTKHGVVGGALNSRGVVGGVVVFWDNMVLQVWDIEVGRLFVSCRFKNCEDNVC